MTLSWGRFAQFDTLVGTLTSEAWGRIRLVASSSSHSASASPTPGSRRPRGTGALLVKRDSAGRETWYGKWWVGTTQVKRRVGPKRNPSTREGLTRTQAEAELRRLMGSIEPTVAQPSG